MQVTLESGIKVSYGKVTVAQILPRTVNSKKGVNKAQLKQEVTKIYPATRVGNSESDSLFSTSEFGLQDGKTYKSTRVTLIDVPENATVAQVQAAIDSTKATLFNKYSYNIEDVLTEEQKQAISAGLTTLADFKDKLLVRNAEGKQIEGNAQYRQTFFKKEYVEDVDHRSSVRMTDINKLLAGAENQ